MKRRFTMQTLATTALLSLLGLSMAIFSASAPAAAPDSLLVDTRWEAFAGQPALGSFAWAGEDETLLNSKLVRTVVTDADFDARTLTGLAAPEPPALVLAGVAFGGVLCCRSMLARRRRQAGDAGTETYES
jgi:hypothetical protein